MSRATNTRMLLVAGAVSVGVHAAIAPEHLQEWPALGAAFIVAAAAGAMLVTAVALQPTSKWPARLLGGLFLGLIVAYALTRLFALPPLDPTRESVDIVGVCTSVVEAMGLILVTTGGTA